MIRGNEYQRLQSLKNTLNEENTPYAGKVNEKFHWLSLWKKCEPRAQRTLAEPVDRISLRYIYPAYKSATIVCCHFSIGIPSSLSFL